MSSTETTALITAAIRRLTDVCVNVQPGGCTSVAQQAESFRAFDDHTRAVQDIVSDLLVGLCGLTAGWGDKAINEHDRKRIRECVADAVDDALSDAHSWADEVEQEFREAA